MREGYRKLSKKERERIVRRIGDFFKKLEWVDACIVFGSFVRRDYFKDIDIAIVTNKQVDVERLDGIALELEKEIKADVDIKVFGELNDAVKFEIIKYGRVLFSDKDFSHYRYEFTERYIDFIEWWKKWI